LDGQGTQFAAAAEVSQQFLVLQNLSGRLLVGLRWWNRIKDDGTSEWVYEAHPNAEKRVPAMNSRIFWGGLYGAMIAWVSAALLALLTFDVQWLLVCITALALTGANVTGYTRCSQQAGAASGANQTAGGLSGMGGGLAGAAGLAALPGVLPAITNSISNSIFGTSSAAAQPAAAASAPQGQQAAQGSGGMQGDVTGQTVV